MIAGTIFDDLAAPANRASLMRQTEEICGLASRLPKPAPLKGSGFLRPN